jgi:hypothetical protein
MTPIEKLKSVLCDPEGLCCIHGSAADRACVDEALKELEAAIAVERSKEQAKPDSIQTLLDSQEPLGVEFSKVLHENLADLYEEDAPPEQAKPQQEPDLVQIASDIMGACMNGYLDDKWEDVADLMVTNDFDGLGKLTSREPMTTEQAELLFTQAKGETFADGFAMGIWAAEAHHGITAKPAREPLTDKQKLDLWLQITDNYAISKPAALALITCVEAHYAIEAKLGVTK